MQEQIQQLNQYLEQMLDCVVGEDRDRFNKLNHKYNQLYDKTFLGDSPASKQYDLMRNAIAWTLAMPEKAEEYLPKVREFLRAQG